MFSRQILILSILLVTLHCRKAESPEGPRLVKLDPSDHPIFTGSPEQESLLHALDRQIRWFSENPIEPQVFGDEIADTSRMVATLERFREIWKEQGNRPEDLRRHIAELFHVFRVEWNHSPDILITGYHSPILSGSRTPTQRFRYPLYRMPEDAVTIRPSLFSPAMLRAGTELRHDRVVARHDPDSGDIIPYYTREEIDAHDVLAGRGLELVYLEDYFQAFLFHVQGGGFVKLENEGFLLLQYAGKNSWSYTSIGGLLVSEGKIPKEKISIQAIDAYFERYPDEVTRVCYANKSYVFYQTDGLSREKIEPDMYPSGVLGFPVTPNHSIATDKKYFPGGALGFVQGTQRRPEGGLRPFSVFVLDQDTGGAIKGGHIDYYLGAGDRAEAHAGLLNDARGRLFFLLLRSAGQ